MRLEDAGPRTRLLAALAGLALVAWLLVFAGMDGNPEPLPADPSALDPLPSIEGAPPASLRPLEEYSQLAARPLFAPDRRPHPFFLEVQDTDEAGERPFDYVLTSVLLTPELKMAILQPADGDAEVRVRLDQALESNPRWRLVELGERSAVFAGPEGERKLALRVFDGTGGARPSASVPVAAAPASPPATAAAPSMPSVPLPGEALPSPITGQAEEPTLTLRQRIQARREQLRRDVIPQPPPETP